jgi:histidinol-phosphate aminotransferase
MMSCTTELLDVHGGIDPAELAEYGLRPNEILDFSANVNPFGPPPGVRDAIARTMIDRYPDRSCGELRAKLARRHGVATDSILVGNGASELIWLSAVAWLRQDDPVLIIGPTFGGYERAARVANARVHLVMASTSEGFRPPWEAFSQFLATKRPRLAYLATPNNPTGQTVEARAIARLAKSHSHVGFVLDEAYVDLLADDVGDGDSMPDNVIRLRSLTKSHALAGLRLGYAIANPETIRNLATVQPPWSVNGPAQAAGLAALSDSGHVRKSVACWRRESAELVTRLRDNEYSPMPSAMPFFLLPVADAATARQRLLQRRLLVRDCTSFGLPGYIRICGRTHEENGRLLGALIDLRSEVLPCRT